MTPIGHPRTGSLGPRVATLAFLSLGLAAATMIARRLAPRLPRGAPISDPATGAVDRTRDGFLSMLGHELRNPLHAISMAAQVLQRADGNSAAATRARDVIARQASTLAAKVNGLIDVGQVVVGPGALHCQPFDLAPLVQRALDGACAAARLKDLHLQAALDGVWIRADAKRIAQAVERLLTHAIRHTPAGGNVTIELIEERGVALLRLRHSGIAFAPQWLARIFASEACEPDPHAGDAGNCLALVRRLVELHGGATRGCGEAGETLFEIALPAIRPAVAEGSRMHHASGATRICHDEPMTSEADRDHRGTPIAESSHHWQKKG